MWIGYDGILNTGILSGSSRQRDPEKGSIVIHSTESNLLIISILFWFCFQLANLATGAAVLRYPFPDIARPIGDGSWPPFHTAFGAPGGHHFGGCGQTGLRQRSLEPCWTQLDPAQSTKVRPVGMSAMILDH